MNWPWKWVTDARHWKRLKGQTPPWCMNPLYTAAAEHLLVWEILYLTFCSSIHFWKAPVIFNEQQFKRKVPRFSGVLIQFPVHLYVLHQWIWYHKNWMWWDPKIRSHILNINFIFMWTWQHAKWHFTNMLVY